MTTAMHHWTETSEDDFLYKIAADFIDQLRLMMEAQPVTQSELARRLHITKGRVSQILHDPGNLTLKQIIRYARALGLKVAIVAYDDDDRKNDRGPINSDIFRICWENSGCPNNFKQLTNVATVSVARVSLPFAPAFVMNGRYISSGTGLVSAIQGFSNTQETSFKTAITEKLRIA